jgi:alpha-L-rhamnosidase
MKICVHHLPGKRAATLAAFFCLFASPLLSGAEGMTAKQLQVNYLDAPLGLDGSHVPTPPDEMVKNVTDRLRSFVKNGEIAIPVQTSVVVISGVDPAPGKVKTLNLTYQLDGLPGTITASEGQELHLGKAGDKLVIEEASYGFRSAQTPARMRFGWIVEDSRRGALQSAYQIRVATSKALLEKKAPDVWDSGRVASASQNGIVFEGKPLSGKTAYHWQVQLSDASGKAGAWNEPASFETGILSHSKDWSGVFVNGKDPRDQRFFNYIRRSFSVPPGKSVSRARAYVAGNTGHRAFWDFRINGGRADDTVILKDGGYFTFDVTKALRAGENVVGAIFGDDSDKDTTAKIWICDVDVWFTDNTHLTFGTDATCKGFRGGPFISANELDGVTYDARKEADIAGWDKPGFQDADWLPVTVTSALRPSQSFQRDAVSLHKTLPAVAMTTPAPGVRIYDLGTNISGWARLTVRGTAGTTVTLRHAERLKDDGTLDRSSNLKGIPAEAIDRYTLKGGGTEVLEPWLTWHGFRYVEVTGDVTLTPASIEGRWIHSDITRRSATFSCSDELLNQLFTAFRVGELDNSMYYHIDCNQRGERAPWAADAFACSAPSMAMFDSADFWQRWISTSNQQIGPHGEASHEVRGGGGGFALFWQAYSLLIPWDFHQTYGDQAALRISYQRARAFSDCFINWFDTLDENVVFDKVEKKILSSTDRHDFLIDTETTWKDPDGKNEENAMWYWGDWCHPRMAQLGMNKNTSLLASLF